MALLVGLRNPHSTRPEDALAYWPANASGHRLCQMFVEESGRTPDEYMAGFRRTNLIVGGWERPEDTARRILLSTVEAPTTLVLLGNAVRIAFNRHLQDPVTSETCVRQDRGPLTFHFIHHPSGLSRSYNDPAMRRAVGQLLSQLYEESE
jgi:hypothetical protein